MLSFLALIRVIWTVVPDAFGTIICRFMCLRKHNVTRHRVDATMFTCHVYETHFVIKRPTSYIQLAEGSNRPRLRKYVLSTYFQGPVYYC